MPDSQDALEATDYVVENPPSWLPSPVRRWLGDLTYREWHSAVLGSLGLLAGGGVALGLTAFVAPLAAALLAIALGLQKAPDSFPKPMLVIRREPWYFVVPFVGLATVAYWTVTLFPSL